MNFWAGRTVTLKLSTLGQSVFAEVFALASVEVSVEWADESGLWVFREQVDRLTTTVMLIRWAHFETAIVDVVVAEPEQPNVLGFRR